MDEAAYGEGIASRTGPKSCEGGREAALEAWTGAHAGPVLISEITPPALPTQSRYGEGHASGGVTREPPDEPAESKTRSMRGNSLRGNREVPASSDRTDGRSDRLEKTYKSSMHDAGKSDCGIVPKKPANKGGATAPAESAEGRPQVKGNSLQTATPWTQRRDPVPPGLERVQGAETL